ncbi:hypothetical protein [Bacteroides sp.]|uniref:hypothetical protein n=1 Tax=Bacteroides sp. TaxID=29523 RepID=UPI00262BA9F8|nr:hypothetical protein [Bacteroides sp.]MDD3038870.1 hypothetical protein [Bacteroides sp.]
MIELVKSSVVFNEEDHTYFLGDKQLQGITGMISRQLFPDKYKDIPDFVLKKAAEKGSRIHAQCQFVDSTGFTPESVEAENYLRERTNAGYKAFANEYTVSDNEYFASNIDCVWEKDNRISLGDIKTTYNLDKEYLSWQLSIYAYLFEMQNPLIKVDKLFGIWLRGDKSELIPIERKQDDEVRKLLECEINGEMYRSNTLIPVAENQLISAQLVNTIIDIEEQASYISDVQKEFREKLKIAMRENNVVTFDSGRLRVSYTPASQSNSFDTKKFQAEHSELYAKYLKKATKADSIRVTIREEKE